MPGSTIGALAGLALGAYGRKPKVPTLKPIDVNATQKAAVAGNAANFADIAQLATQVNTFNQDQLDALIDRTLGTGVRQQIQANLSSQLRGEIPDDVRSQIYRGVAERTAGGNAFGGGGFTRNVTARDLGLTSLDITNRALSSAESWLSKAAAPQFDVTSMFFTPQQRLAFEEEQQSRQFQRDSIEAGVKAAPDPWRAALAQGIDQDVVRIENAALSTFGGQGTPGPQQDAGLGGDSTTSDWRVGAGGLGIGRQSTNGTARWYLGRQPGPG